MRKILSCAAMAVWAALLWSTAMPAQVAKAPAKKSVAQKGPAAPAKSGAAVKPPVAARTTQHAAPRTTNSGTAGARTPVSPTAAGGHTTGTRTSASHQTNKPAVPRTTWRNRQTVPSPERYKEIQDALVAKGYLKPELAAGAWGDASTSALKRFQADQNLDSSGKIQRPLADRSRTGAEARGGRAGKTPLRRCPSFPPDARKGRTQSKGRGSVQSVTRGDTGGHENGYPGAAGP